MAFDLHPGSLPPDLNPAEQKDQSTHKRSTIDHPHQDQCLPSYLASRSPRSTTTSGGTPPGCTWQFYFNQPPLKVKWYWSTRNGRTQRPSLIDPSLHSGLQQIEDMGCKSTCDQLWSGCTSCPCRPGSPASPPRPPPCCLLSPSPTPPPLPAHPRRRGQGNRGKVGEQACKIVRQALQGKVQ